MRRVSRTVTVSAEVHLGEFEDDAIRSEYELRGLGSLSLQDEDTRYLADLIASGCTNEALDLLHKLTQGAFPLAFVKRHTARSLSS